MEHLNPKWTKDLLERMTSKELLAMVAAYGADQIAARMDYTDIVEFLREKHLDSLKETYEAKTDSTTN
jgi:hypothetical protein